MKTGFKHHLFIFLFIFIEASASELNIAVAANVSYTLNDLKAEFLKSHPDTKIRFILGSSGKLSAQIKNGAPYGLFLSANMDYPQALYNEGLALSRPEVYAQGALACFSVKGLDLSKGLSILKDNKVRKIAIANPKTAPYGKASIEAMKNAGIYEAIKYKFVYAESIAQAVSYTHVATQIGIIAKSSLYSSHMRQYEEAKEWVELDRSLYTPIKQGIIQLKLSKNSPEYKAFYDFILSKRAQIIFSNYGYISQ